MKGTINHFFAPSAKGLVGAMGRAALVLLCVLSAAGAWAQSTSSNFTVSGNTYTIQNAAGWDEFCNAVTAGGNFSGKTIVLARDITVTSMAGNGDTGFQGTFNGGGHTLTLHYGSPEAHVDAQFVAPFPAVTGGATFSNLNIDGYIYSTYTTTDTKPEPGVGGLIGHLFGDITIEHCTSAVEITSTTDRVGGFVGLCEHSVSFSNCVSSAVVHCSAGNNSGFVGWSRASGYTISFEGCLFNGKLLQTNGQGAGGGFVGWKGDSKTVYITNCLYAPAPLAAGEDYVSGGATFCCQHNDQLPADITNCYYTQAFGAAQGNQARAISGGEHVTLANAGTPVVTYTTSGITSYGTGIKYDNVFYAGVDDEVSLTLSSDQPAEGYSFSGYNVTPDGATLTGSDANGWMLTMPDADVTIGAVYTPITYSITYDLGGGALPEGRANPENYTVESETFTLVNPERDGYVFAGWTGGGLSEPTKEVTIAKGSTTGNKTFTATWQMPPIAYIDVDGTTKACTNYTMLTGSESELAEGWYVADGTISFDHQLRASGNIHLILMDGAVMRIGTEESPVSDDGIVAYYYSISIHGQSTGESRGQLWINATYNGIAAYYGNVEISGGTVEAKGTENCGIYAIQSDYDVSSISMTGATVTAEGAAFGIYTGCGYLTAKGCTINATSTNDYGHCIYSDDANITLTDCEVTATGNGSGIYADGGNVEISGGTVEAKGTKVRGIFATRHFNGGSISMTGATVTAEGANGGIWAEGGHLTAEDCTINATVTNGFGIYSYNGNITLTDCEVTATGSDMGIYAHGSNVEISSGEVHAKGSGDDSDGIYIDGGYISMTGATVTAEGAAYGIIIYDGHLTAENCTINATNTNDYGYGIYSSDANITLTNCEVTATGSGYGIYAQGGNVEISEGQVTAKGTKNCGIYAIQGNDNGGSISMTGATVTAEGAANGIYTSDGHLTAEDCTINATSTNDCGIYSSDGNITLTDCEVTATSDFIGIYADGGNVEISGGQVTATATNYDGIAASGSITLSWNAPTDFIEVNSYYTAEGGTITLAKAFTDGDGNIYSGVIDKEEDGTYAINGKKLLPYIGDANGDYVVTIADVVMVVSYLVNGVEPEGFDFDQADVDGSGTVDTTDLRAIVDMILEE